MDKPKTVKYGQKRYNVAKMEKEGWYLKKNYKKEAIPFELRATVIFVPMSLLPKGAELYRTQFLEESEESMLSSRPQDYVELPDEEKGHLLYFTHEDFNGIKEGECVSKIKVQATKPAETSKGEMNEVT